MRRESGLGINGDHFATGSTDHQHPCQAVRQYFHKFHVCNDPEKPTNVNVQIYQ